MRTKHLLEQVGLDNDVCCIPDTPILERKFKNRPDILWTVTTVWSTDEEEEEAKGKGANETKEEEVGCITDEGPTNVTDKQSDPASMASETAPCPVTNSTSNSPVHDTSSVQDISPVLDTSPVQDTTPPVPISAEEFPELLLSAP